MSWVRAGAAFLLVGLWAVPGHSQNCAQLSSPSQIPSYTRVNFDELGDGQQVADTYRTSLGVSFETTAQSAPTAYSLALQPGEAQSPPNVVFNYAITGTSAGVPMRITFASPKTHVGFYIGNGETLDITARISAYDAAGQPLCSFTFNPVPQPHTVFFGLNYFAGGIRTVTLDYGSTTQNESIDDLVFSPPAASTPTPTRTATRTPTPPATATPSSTASPTDTPTATASPTSSATSTPTPLPGVVPPYCGANSAAHDVSSLLAETRSLWVGTQTCLLHWDLGADPAELTTYEPLSSGLPSLDISALVRGPDGALWIATRDNGVARFDDFSWQHYTAANTGGGASGLPTDEVLSAVADPKRNGMWFGLVDPTSVAFFDGASWSSWEVPVAPDIGVSGLAVDPSGELWIATAAGAFSFDGNTFGSYGAAEGLPTDLTTVMVDRVGSNDRVWFGTESEGVFRRDNGFTFEPMNTDLPYTSVAQLTKAPNGTIWCAPANPGDAGARNHAQPVSFNESTGAWVVAPDFPNTSARLTSTSATNDMVAFGSHEEGVFLLDGLGSRSVRANPVSLDVGVTPACSSPTTLVLDGNGHLWVGCPSTGIAEFDGKEWTRYTSLDTPGITSDAITSSAFEPPDTLYFGTMGGGVLLRLGNGTFQSIKSTDGLASDDVQAVAVGADGAKWFGTKAGVTRMQGMSLSSFHMADGLIQDAVNSVAIEPDGTVWFAADDGVSRYNGTWTNFHAGRGAGSPIPGNFDEIKVGPDGMVWAVSRTGGAVFYQGGKWQAVTTDDGLPSNVVSSVGFDPDGAVWLGSGNSVVKWDGGVLDRVDARDGLPRGKVNEILPDAGLSGRLFLTSAGAGIVTLNAGRNVGVELEEPETTDLACSSVQLRWSRYRGTGFAGYRVLRAQVPLLPAQDRASLLWWLALTSALTAGAITVKKRRMVWTGAALSMALAASAALDRLAVAGPFWEVVTEIPARSGRSFVDDTVQGSSRYLYRVDVKLAGGHLPLPSNVVQLVVQAQAPAAPPLDLVSASTNAVTLSWPAPAASLCSATSLRLSRVAGSNHVDLGLLPPAANNAFLDNTVASETRYRYVLEANANSTAGPPSELSVLTGGTTVTGGCSPPPPRNLRGRPASKDDIRLDWREPIAPSSCTAHGFAVYRVQGQSRTLVDTVGPGETTARDPNRRPGTSYTYAVTTLGPVESELSAKITVTTPPSSVRVFVPGDRASVRTGFVPPQGSSFRIAALSGQVRFNTIQDFGSLVDPPGFDRVNFLVQWPDDAAVPDPLQDIGDGHAGLLAIVDGQTRFVGNERAFTSNGGGEVRLGINDNTLSSPEFLINTGGFLVEISPQ